MATAFDTTIRPDTGPGIRPDTEPEQDSVFAGFGTDPVDDAFNLISEHIRGLEPRSALARIRRYEDWLGALQTDVVAKLNTESGSDRLSKRWLNDGKRSKKSVAKAARRGDAAAKNPDLIDKMATGELSEEQLDVIAEASDKTDGAAATDAAFIDEVAGVDPDQAKTIADKFITNHADPEGTETELERQRRLRRALTYHAKKNGLDAVVLEGDGVAAKNMWDKITARAKELYEADGGRDLATGKHPRTREQRLFDAAYELICDVTTTPSGTIHQSRHTSTRGTGHPQIFVGITIDKYLGSAPGELAEQIGLGAIPDSVLADYLEHADIIGVLYDKNGEPLWLGRAKRHATLMQRYALIARDKACVKCGTSHQQCEVHHRMPWNAPGKGHTDLDQLVLLCGPCHRGLHTANLTIYQDDKRVWRTRPATPTETPPNRNEYPQRE